MQSKGNELISAYYAATGELPGTAVDPEREAHSRAWVWTRIMVCLRVQRWGQAET